MRIHIFIRVGDKHSRWNNRWATQDIDLLVAGHRPAESLVCCVVLCVLRCVVRCVFCVVCCMLCVVCCVCMCCVWCVVWCVVWYDVMVWWCVYVVLFCCVVLLCYFVCCVLCVVYGLRRCIKGHDPSIGLVNRCFKTIIALDDANISFLIKFLNFAIEPHPSRLKNARVVRHGHNGLQQNKNWNIQEKKRR